MTREERNKDYKENFNAYVEELMKFTDTILEKKLDLVLAQKELAIKNKDEEVYETLMLWERHIIHARILRSELNENEIEPYVNEIELAIAENNREAKQYAERHKVIENNDSIMQQEVEDIQSSYNKIHKTSCEAYPYSIKQSDRKSLGLDIGAMEKPMGIVYWKADAEKHKEIIELIAETKALSKL